MTIKRLYMIVGWLLFLMGFAFVPSQASDRPESIRHELHVRLYPSEGRLSGDDTIRVLPHGAKSLTFTLSPETVVDKVTVQGREKGIRKKGERLSIPLNQHEREAELRVRISYQGRFGDAVPENPVNTDNPGYGVTGHISEKGTFLQSGAGWYPEIEGSHPRFLIRVDAPTGVLAVTAGRSLGHVTKDGKTTSIWESRPLLEGLSLSAARYDVRERSYGDIKAMTYLFPESDDLARPYLDAVVRYMETYEALFGPYPFEKFAVVENFFPTGYGFPSYTLLGSRVIRLPFIIHTSLPHEIAHCWWGNGVHVDYRQGNWSEGLTTYVSDYLMKERVSDEKGRAYRQQILRNMTSLVNDEKDFPLNRFMGRYNPASQAIGYGKGAMVFHMIRERIGDEAFWGALRDVYREKRFQRVSWSDFRDAFEQRCGCALKTFMGQWVDRPGALRLSLKGVRFFRDGDLWRVVGRLVQHPPLYETGVEISVQTESSEIRKEVAIQGEITSFSIEGEGVPKRLVVDPDYDLFRRLYPSEVPPSINHLKAASSLIIVLAEQRSSRRDDVMMTLVQSLGVKGVQVIEERDMEDRMLEQKSVLIIGAPKTESLKRRFSEDMTASWGGFSFQRESFDRSSHGFFGVFSHPSGGDEITAVYLPASAREARQVAGKVSHYGRYSYLIFRKGRNIKKGVWPVLSSPLIHVWK